MSRPPVRLVCPACGSDDLTSWEDSYTGYRGVRWYRDGQSIVVDYDEVYDTTLAEGGAYRDDLTCRHCDTALRQADLVPEGSGPDPDWTPPERQQLLDSDVALDAIAALLHARVWHPADDLESIADTLRKTGRTIRDPA